MDGWRRPYRSGLGRWIVALWEGAAMVFLHRTSAELFHLDGRPADILAVVLGAFWVALCVRLARMGVFVGGGGIQIRGLVTRRTIPWRAIERITVQHVSQRVLGLTIPAGRAAVIELRDGGHIDSTLSTEGVDFKFSPKRFVQACTQLRAEHASARQLTTNPT
ncbi:PH domain-containing protein [Virgisporangium aurantiacum]|uniref:Low molecular weight protein antigen 6 PH domain-containing protein n=1 Tax=Virgisporangium aurantiacum TaxID=175570 RepID=A0A8J3Z6B5_9ACTN|nr:PH domain-containing protein [Virgisporangium aurantiacum]GIJ58279.1 hypothetical protein Vau01_057950 [Virgisporangium aurantiacum]